MQYIYRFFNNNNECLYVGKTIHLKPRFNQHKKDKLWWDEITKIEYAECEKDFMIDLYEIYYINKLKAKYNAKDIKIKYIKFEYPELEFKDYIFKINKIKRRK